MKTTTAAMTAQATAALEAAAAVDRAPAVPVKTVYIYRNQVSRSFGLSLLERTYCLPGVDVPRKSVVVQGLFLHPNHPLHRLLPPGSTVLSVNGTDVTGEGWDLARVAAEMSRTPGEVMTMAVRSPPVAPRPALPAADLKTNEESKSRGGGGRTKSAEAASSAEGAGSTKRSSAATAVSAAALSSATETEESEDDEPLTRVIKRRRRRLNQEPTRRSRRKLRAVIKMDPSSRPPPPPSPPPPPPPPDIIRGVDGAIILDAFDDVHIDVTYDVEASDPKWHSSYQRLLLLRNRDLTIPSSTQYVEWLEPCPTDHPELSLWVSEQRVMYADRREIIWRNAADSTRVQSTLAKIRMLESVHFVWMTRTEYFQTMEDLPDLCPGSAEWKGYCLRFAVFVFGRGHGNVPNFTELGMWCGMQRIQRREGRLSVEKVRALNCLGFDWTERGEELADWSGMRARLADFRRENGDCLVMPPKEADDPDIVVCKAGLEVIFAKGAARGDEGKAARSDREEAGGASADKGTGEASGGHPAHAESEEGALGGDSARSEGEGEAQGSVEVDAGVGEVSGGDPVGAEGEGGGSGGDSRVEGQRDSQGGANSAEIAAEVDEGEEEKDESDNEDSTEGEGTSGAMEEGNGEQGGGKDSRRDGGDDAEEKEDWSALWWWVQHQRIERNRLRIHEMDSFLTNSRIASLDRLEFIWTSTLNARWIRNYRDLKAYAAQNGTFVIKGSERLCTFLCRIRIHYRKMKKREEADRRRTEEDMARRAALQASLLQVSGGRDSCSSGAEEEKIKKKELAASIKLAVRDWRDFPPKLSSNLTPDAIRLLDSINFPWDLPITNKDDEFWDAKFEELRRYKEKHGDCHVHQALPSGLGRWVQQQRRNYHFYKHGTRGPAMNDERIRRLEELGFLWRIRGRRGKGCQREDALREAREAWKDARAKRRSMEREQGAQTLQSIEMDQNGGME